MPAAPEVIREGTCKRFSFCSASAMTLQRCALRHRGATPCAPPLDFVFTVCDNAVVSYAGLIR